MYQNLCNATKAILRRKFITINAYIKMKKKKKKSPKKLYAYCKGGVASRAVQR